MLEAVNQNSKMHDRLTCSFKSITNLLSCLCTCRWLSDTDRANGKLEVVNRWEFWESSIKGRWLSLHLPFTSYPLSSSCYQGKWDGWGMAALLWPWDKHALRMMEQKDCRSLGLWRAARSRPSPSWADYTQTSHYVRKIKPFTGISHYILNIRYLLLNVSLKWYRTVIIK